MRFTQAKRLHNGDQITSKETGEVMKVINIAVKGPKDGLVKPTVFVETVSQTDGWQEYMHTEIR